MKYLQLGRWSREELPEGTKIYVDGKPGRFIENAKNGETWYTRDEDGEEDIAVNVVVEMDDTCYCNGTGSCFMCEARARG